MPVPSRLHGLTSAAAAAAAVVSCCSFAVPVPPGSVAVAPERIAVDSVDGRSAEVTDSSVRLQGGGAGSTVSIPRPRTPALDLPLESLTAPRDPPLKAAPVRRSAASSASRPSGQTPPKQPETSNDSAPAPGQDDSGPARRTRPQTELAAAPPDPSPSFEAKGTGTQDDVRPATRSENGQTTADGSAAADGPAVRYGYLPPAQSASAVGSRVTGTVATWALLAIAGFTLVLRLSVGWPRFPPRYRGRRRSRP